MKAKKEIYYLHFDSSVMMMNEMVKESGTFLSVFSVAIRFILVLYFPFVVALFDFSNDKDSAEQFWIFDVLCSTLKKVGYTIICI